MAIKLSCSGRFCSTEENVIYFSQKLLVKVQSYFPVTFHFPQLYTLICKPCACCTTFGFNRVSWCMNLCRLCLYSIHWNTPFWSMQACFALPQPFTRSGTISFSSKIWIYPLIYFYLYVAELAGNVTVTSQKQAEMKRWISTEVMISAEGRNSAGQYSLTLYAGTAGLVLWPRLLTFACLARPTVYST